MSAVSLASQDEKVTLWCITIPLGYLCAFILRLPILFVYFVLYLDEILFQRQREKSIRMNRRTEIIVDDVRFYTLR